ncbi:MAG: hypothetical protein IJM24_09970 [Clostridia bacterium]|nr:hypothetical protein [Clostridia bacterium]
MQEKAEDSGSFLTLVKNALLANSLIRGDLQGKAENAIPLKTMRCSFYNLPAGLRPLPGTLAHFFVAKSEISQKSAKLHFFSEKCS